jgi:flagellin-specific chaperone FliS
MNQEDYASEQKMHGKNKSIFNYLCVALNRNMMFQTTLYKLYTFFNQESSKRGVRCDQTVLEGILPLVTDSADTHGSGRKYILSMK